MPNAYTGSGGVFKIGTSSSNLTTVSGNDSGLTNVDFSRETPHRIIPGGGVAHRQLTGTSDWTLSFSIDANAITWPLLAFKNGSTLYFEWSPIGTTSGTPKITGSGIISVPVPMPTDDVIRFDVTIEADGPYAEGTN